jgi:sarcosine oxidase
LSGSCSADVVIIGAGFTGLSAALHLAKAGLKAVVLEAEEPGFGGSGRNVGLVNAGMWVMPDDLPDTLGPVYGPRLLRFLGDAPQAVYDLVEEYGMDCELERKGTLHCAADSAGFKELSERARQWKAHDAPVKLLDEKEAAARTGSSAYHGALFDARAGTIQPLSFARGLANAALSEGATIHAATPALSAQRRGSTWRVETPAGAVEAEWIIVATNAYTHAPWPELRDEIVRFPYFNFATRPLGDNLRKSILPGGEGAWDTKEVLSSFRMDAAGRLVFGSVGALANGGRAVHEAWARRAIARLFPQIGPVEFEDGWYGLIGMTAESLPRMHVLDTNILSISGYNGRGIAPGTVFGRALADYVSGKCRIEDMPMAATEPKRQSFKAVRERYYEFGAQIAHVAGARI